MKKFYISFILLFAACLATNVYAQKPVLKFNKDGKFKIVQFTDMHCVLGDPKAETAYAVVNAVLKKEKPDLVIFTGDLVHETMVKEGYRTVLELVSKRKIPFGAVLGNHDKADDTEPEEIFDAIRDIPYNLTDVAPGLPTVPNFVLPILSSDGKGKTAAALYCFHLWSSFAQTEWYQQQSDRMTQENGGKPLPSFAFMHMPINEIFEAVADYGTGLFGTRLEKPEPYQQNYGLYTAMLEKGDVKGVFFGHEHDCDFIVNRYGILLAYGRHSGGESGYCNMPGGSGARVIELTEGETAFDTWVRLASGEVLNKLNHPNQTIR